MPHWERPNPPRLNDTSAIVRKGIRQSTLVMAHGKTNDLEDICVPEFAFGGGPSVGVGHPVGAGAVVKVKESRSRGTSSSPDKNRTVPGNGGSLAAAIACVNKGC